MECDRWTIMASKQQELEVLESWEDFDETEELEKKIKNLITSNKIDNRSNGISKVPTTTFNIILTGDDALRTQYVPPEPTVKILKRPTKDSQGTSDNNRSFQPKKTLQQREQEYAEARLRILGEQQPEQTEEKITIQNKSRQPEMDNVIRLPKGPDGTKGFNLRR